MMRRLVPLLIACRKGAAAAEMALILPVAVIIMFASLEGAHYFYTEHQVIKGVRDGARWGARQAFTDINCTGGTASGVPATVRDNIRNLTRTGQLTGGNARVIGWEDDDITVAVTCADSTVTASQGGIFNSSNRAAIITVTADVDYVSLFGGIGVIGDDAQLRATQQATVMGI